LKASTFESKLGLKEILERKKVVGSSSRKGPWGGNDKLVILGFLRRMRNKPKKPKARSAPNFRKDLLRKPPKYNFSLRISIRSTFQSRLRGPGCARSGEKKKKKKTRWVSEKRPACGWSPNVSRPITLRGGGDGRGDQGWRAITRGCAGGDA